MQIYDDPKYFELELEKKMRESEKRIEGCPIWDVLEEKRLEAVDVKFTD